MCNREYNSLKSKIVSLYGEAIHKQLRWFEKLRSKRARLLSSIVFLKRCRAERIIPKCVELTKKLNIKGSDEIITRTSEMLLKNVIKKIISNNYCEIDHVNCEMYKCHLLLSKSMNADDFNFCDSLSYNQCEKIAESCRVRHTNKYEKLTKKSNKNNVQCAVQIVKNLSSKELDESTISVLSKGMNFAPTPINIPTETIIGSVEECIRRNKIDRITSETIRQDVSVLIRKAKQIIPNITLKERNSLKKLSLDEELIVLPADKGNCTVVLDVKDYNSKMLNLLEDVSTYQEVNYDPTARVLRKVRQKTTEYKSAINKINIIPSCPQPPKLYGLPKVHKENIPLRPIVCQIDSPTYLLAKELAIRLKPLVNNCDSSVKNSQHFISMIKDTVLNVDEVMVSFDVTSLFTNVPIKECVQVIKTKLSTSEDDSKLLELLDLCLTSGYFLFNQKFYLQIDGVAMGSPVAPVIADIWMQHFEEKAINTSPVKPTIWKRYVDDTFCILKSNEVETFLNHLNSVHQKIQFTMEMEKDNSLPFLDVKLLKNPNGTIGHTVYRKSTHTDRYLHATSHHHPSNLTSVVSSLINRANAICDKDHLNEELKHVDMVLSNNGYNKKQRSWKPKPQDSNNVVEGNEKRAFLPYRKGVSEGIGRILSKHGIKSIFKPPAKIRQILRSPKDKILLQNPGVYSVPCSCGSFYIGETKRSIKTRLNEHIKAIQNNQVTKSAICEHLAYNNDHFIRFDKAKSIATERFYVPRLVREAIEIKLHTNFNRDQSFNLSGAWDPLLHKLKQNKNKNRTIEQADAVSFVCSQAYINAQQQLTAQQTITDQLQQQSTSQMQLPPQSTHRYNLRRRE